MQRVPYGDLLVTLGRILLTLGFEEQRARRCAQLFAEASLDGVYSHGLNRFPLFVSMIQSGAIDIHAKPVFVSGSESLERWDGQRGPGNLNADSCMSRAIAISRTHGLGCVALANTNHWMRGGTYGWQAADAGVIGICWTNTMPNLPPWGASKPLLGNNPLVLAVPRAQGHVVLDMALSQFSYGALSSYRMRDELLPVDGGFDNNGRLTRVPAAIEQSKRPLPIGYWKGSGLALMLDLIAGILSGGRTTHQIEAKPELEIGLSQVFIAIDPSSVDQDATAALIADQVIHHLESAPRSTREFVRYPGQQVAKIRRENRTQGIPVDSSVWRQVKEMSGNSNQL